AQTTTSRRAFLRTASLTAVGAGALAACGKAAGASSKLASASVAHDPHATMPPAPPVIDPRAAADAMDAMHEKGIKAFPAKTAAHGNQLLAPTIVAGVKVYELTSKVVQWETEPGK